MANAQEEFTIEGLRSLVRQLNDDPSRLVAGDWRQALFADFALDDDQRRVVDDYPEEDHRVVQAAFEEGADAIKNGGHVDLTVVKEVGGDERTLYFAVATTPQGDPQPDVGRWFKILCCDANCRDWHLCWRRKGGGTIGGTETAS